jgi:hypothetical protein
MAGWLALRRARAIEASICGVRQKRSAVGRPRVWYAENGDRGFQGPRHSAPRETVRADTGRLPLIYAPSSAHSTGRAAPPFGSQMGVSDEPKSNESRARYQFTDEAIDRFLAAKWQMEECEVCHQTTTWVHLRPRPLSLIPASDGSTHAVGRALTSLLRLFCSNCGNTKFLDAEVIRRWLDSDQT